MSTEIAPRISAGGALDEWRPEKVHANQAKADAVIDWAKRMNDWPALEAAIDVKLDDQEEFVRWWDESVRRDGRPSKTVADQGPFLAVEAAEDLTNITKQQVSKWKKRLADRLAYRALIAGAAWKKAMEWLDKGEHMLQDISNEHYTPEVYIAAARRVLGDIDLDPATCEIANRTVQAKHIYTQAQDGLKQAWNGRIWLNPPYGGMAGDFIAKLMEEIVAGNAEAAIILVNAHCTDTAWFRPLWNGVLCFTDHRINFYGGGERSGSTHGSVFAYFGEEDAIFADEFQQFGAVVKGFWK